jgi:hypothetical protein
VLVVGSGRGLGRRNGGVLVVELGLVADVFREDETTKMVNQIEVRYYSFGARGYFHVLRLIHSTCLALSTDAARGSCGSRHEQSCTGHVGSSLHCVHGATRESRS